MGRLQNQFHYAKIILLELRDEPLRWSELEKRFFEKSGSHSRFTSLMRWLRNNEYILKNGPSKSRTHYRVNYEKVSFNENGSVHIKFS